MTRLRKTAKHYFTLTELLVVLAIFAILLSLLFPSLNRAFEKANSIICLNNLFQLGLIIHEMSLDKRGKPIPVLSRNQTDVPKWLKDHPTLQNYSWWAWADFVAEYKYNEIENKNECYKYSLFDCPSNSNDIWGGSYTRIGSNYAYTYTLGLKRFINSSTSHHIYFSWQNYPNFNKLGNIHDGGLAKMLLLTDGIIMFDDDTGAGPGTQYYFRGDNEVGYYHNYGANCLFADNSAHWEFSEDANANFDDWYNKANFYR